ncbi:hypothetical protein [Sinanaerobacter chloroacetimidivorans]|uniref:Uncharacterized protein n=1 Tax=Sinanaerobacter chloroacetimidivorans TaxID=2818044 RepID=A0A8J7W0K4_9FIRM|nr:hypothetical protein [Sinanaerobacter chloroacetimidivorans]MBR0598161.1 hypothetical protein [Sinanaerobacter chloroacetimidivorans]
MQGLRIKSKRDWFIAFVFAFLFIYLIALKFQNRISELLWPLTPDKISLLNQPDGQGVFAAAVLAMTALSIGVMIYKKVKGKYLVFALVGGIVIAGAAIGVYYYECQSIINIPSECKPEGVSVTYHDERGPSFIDYALSEKTKDQIVNKVLALQPLSGEEKKELNERNDTGGSGGETSVSIWYPKKDGYSYLISVSMKDNVIYTCRGRSPESIVIYQDNGLLEVLEKMKT